MSLIADEQGCGAGALAWQHQHGMAQMRQRKSALQELQENPSMEGLKTALPKMDIFPKLEEEHRVRSDAGGVSSLVAFVFIAIMFLSEFAAYVRPPLVERSVTVRAPHSWSHSKARSTSASTCCGVWCLASKSSASRLVRPRAYIGTAAGTDGRCFVRLFEVSNLPLAALQTRMDRRAATNGDRHLHKWSGVDIGETTRVVNLDPSSGRDVP